MDKVLLFSGRTEKGIFTYVIDNEQPFLVKTAAEYHPEIANYINSAKKIPGKTQILLTALGAGEIWGNNVNGDFFPESALSHFGEDYGYKTFEYNAKLYKHHVNKDPTAGYGDVKLSVYNQKFRRVELIVILDNARAPDIAERMDSGDYPEWSMGCKVPFDVCSICGNKAPTRAHYCEHLKYYMGRIHPETGKMAYAINYTPKFFDISQVLIGADKIARTLKKVASVTGGSVIGSALLAEKLATNKVADIVKEIPNTPPASQDDINTLVKAIPEVKARETPFPAETMDALSKHNLKDVLSTMVMMGIIPKPQEFQKLFLISVGKRDMAEALEAKNTCFDPMMVPTPYPVHERLLGVNGDRFSSAIMDLLAPHMADRSYAAPHLMNRITILIKRGSKEYLPKFIKVGDDKERKPIGAMTLMMLMAGAYAALTKVAPIEAVSKVDKLVEKNPKLLMALLAGAAITPSIFNKVVGTNVRGQFDAATPISPDVNDVIKRVEEQRQKPFLKVGEPSYFGSSMPSAALRAITGLPAIYIASNIMQKHKDAHPYEQEGRMRSFIRRNPDVLSALLVLTPRVLPGFKSSIQKAASSKLSSPFVNAFVGKQKIASAQDFVGNAFLWPIAFGSKGLPGRVLGGVLDQTVIEGSKKVLSRRDKNRNTERS